MRCHKELHPLMNIYGLVKKQCPVCGKAYYEKLETGLILKSLIDTPTGGDGGVK